ncbi:MAG: YloN [Candidatus Uhrbacteria bacterium GW2011_GWF2_41_16]|jgi:adenine C2-methylase RlmN of 23S rRNA A2503 and tRNA A37|uniref:YloN n=2 Tax=Candidatus Uhriibacteriota TaxID=1752732 RepID=A0A0G0VD12_9BACT|nr:MAG: YloN [Candidatus Uhrbacteria bacterium GW2011_GWA2_41_10]KKR87849.1 MAG: YloN [Candidatus Uhrbacteria bacterium GW2011_GWC2_41_11]KKR98788.1 MAG: YloN [Candidatus Uhrbacteria bacterium GW2011_GWF2_41_16]HBP00369.1 23S rRNA (adenine(2503)-C(2))-methyltransferase RlmN [Candidatus Uhrbacteria bacterium]
METKLSLLSRKEQFQQLFPSEPSYRWKQIETAFFDGHANGWQDVQTLPKSVREGVEQEILWMTVETEQVYDSKQSQTFKAILKTRDGLFFETVLMENRTGQWTICVSSQIGCAMRCSFCATGTMGLKRSLLSDEIVDQYRFWMSFLKARPEISQRISNVVFMGMGEPMANYENVKQAIRMWLTYTDIGSTHITVSTVGILTQLDRLLTDPDWPSVRIAISLHSANQEKRREIIPTTVDDFLVKLADWSHRYAETLGNRKHHVTYEYLLLNKVNDGLDEAKELAQFIRSTSSGKINVIPYNPVPDKPFERSQRECIDQFKNILVLAGLDVTERRSMGNDIAAACGQLVTTKKNVQERS